MEDIKEGDLVEATKTCSGTKIGGTYAVVGKVGNLRIIDCTCVSTWKLVKNNKTSMQKLGTMMKKLLDADIQTLVKAGFIDGNLDLTSEGSNELENVIFDDYKAKLVVVAKAKLDEEATSNRAY